MTQRSDIPTPPSGPVFASVPLDAPIQRGEQRIDQVQVRRPQAGELRGVQIADVANLDVLALIKVLPRVTVPALTEAELGNMDPSDFTALGAELSGFLLTRRRRDSLGL